MSAKKRQMNGVTAKGRSKKDTKHVRLHHYLLRSDAYNALPCTARALLVEMYDLYNGQNNGELFLSVREAARRIGTSPNTARKAFAELQEKGFIRVNQAGSFDWKENGKATSWVLTEHAFNGALPTKEFMRWKPEAGIRK